MDSGVSSGVDCGLSGVDEVWFQGVDSGCGLRVWIQGEDAGCGLRAWTQSVGCVDSGCSQAVRGVENRQNHRFPSILVVRGTDAGSKTSPRLGSAP